MRCIYYATAHNDKEWALRIGFDVSSAFASLISNQITVFGNDFYTSWNSAAIVSVYQCMFSWLSVVGPILVFVEE